MSPKLQLIAKRMKLPPLGEKAPPPADGHGLGMAIESLIADEVERRVGEAMEQQRKQPAHVNRLMDQFNKPAPVSDYRQLPTTPAPKVMQATIERDGAGLARAIVVNGQRLLAQRDGAGQLIGVISDDLVSEVLYNGKPVPPPNRGN